MADLKATVWLYDEDGQLVSFGPGDTVPAWAKKQVGEHAYGEVSDGPEIDPDGAPVGEPDVPAKKAAAKRSGN